MAMASMKPGTSLPLMTADWPWASIEMMRPVKAKRLAAGVVDLCWQAERRIRSRAAAVMAALARWLFRTNDLRGGAFGAEMAHTVTPGCAGGRTRASVPPWRILCWGIGFILLVST